MLLVLQIVASGVRVVWAGLHLVRSVGTPLEPVARWLGLDDGWEAPLLLVIVLAACALWLGDWAIPAIGGFALPIVAPAGLLVLVTALLVFVLSVAFMIFDLHGPRPRLRPTTVRLWLGGR